MNYRASALPLLLVGFAACKAPSPGETLPGPGPDREQTEFSSPRPEGGAGGAERTAAPAAPGDTTKNAASGATRLIEEGDIVKLAGTTLYVLNHYRGLQIVELSNPRSPVLLGATRFYGDPRELYVRGDRAYAIISSALEWSPCVTCPNGVTGYRGSKVVAVDVSSPRAPRLVAEIRVDGDITDTRLVGDVLYAVSNEYSWYGYPGVSALRDQTFVASIQIADPSAPRTIARLDFPRNGWQNHINVTTSAIFIASPAYGNWGGMNDCPAEAPCTKITNIDISDPAGALTLGGSRVLAGFVQDRWQLDYDTTENVLRLVTFDLGWGGSFRGPMVRTLRVGPTDLTPLGEVEIPLAQRESTTAVRFDGDRAYVVTFERIDPLFTVDLSDAAHPVVRGQLESPGFLDYIEPRGDRLIALGHDQDANGQWHLQVSLYDTSNLDKPALLDRELFGGAWGWTPGDRDDFQKVFKVVDSLGLIVLPYVSWGDDGTGWWRGTGNVQLFDFSRSSIELRGSVRQNGYTERAIPYEGTKLLAVSSEVLDVLDISDRSRPSLLGTLELSREILDIAVSGNIAVETTGDPWGSGQESAIVVVPSDDPNTTTPIGRLALPRPVSRSFLSGRNLYLLSPSYWRNDRNGQGVQVPARILVVDASSPQAPRQRGALDLPDTMNGYCGGGRYVADIAVGGRGGYGYGYGWGCGESMLLVGSTSLAQYSSSYCAEWNGQDGTCSRTVPAHVQLIDLSNPDAPALGAKVEIPNVDWIGGFSAEGSTIFLTHYASFEQNGQWWVRYYLDRIDVSNPAAPVLHPGVNIPGRFIGASADGRTIYTVEDWSDSNGSRTRIHALELAGNTAVLRASHEVAGSVSEVAHANGIVYALFDRYTPSPGSGGVGTTKSGSAGAGGSATGTGSGTATGSGSQTTTDGRYLLVVDARNPNALVGTETRLADHSGYWWWGGLELSGGKLFLRSWESLLVFGLSNPLAPAFEGFHRMQGYASRIVVSNGHAYLPSGRYGVERIGL